MMLWLINWKNKFLNTKTIDLICGSNTDLTAIMNSNTRKSLKVDSAPALMKIYRYRTDLPLPEPIRVKYKKNNTMIIWNWSHLNLTCTLLYSVQMSRNRLEWVPIWVLRICSSDSSRADRPLAATRFSSFSFLACSSLMTFCIWRPIFLFSSTRSLSAAWWRSRSVRLGSLRTRSCRAFNRTRLVATYGRQIYRRILVCKFL